MSSVFFRKFLWLMLAMLASAVPLTACEKDYETIKLYRGANKDAIKTPEPPPTSNPTINPTLNPVINPEPAPSSPSTTPSVTESVFAESATTKPGASEIDEYIGLEFSHLKPDGEIEPFKRGKSAVLKVIGYPDTEYTLRVFYYSGESSAAGLGSALSDIDGKVSWTWNVGAGTRTGVFFAIITGGGESVKIDIKIVDNN